MPRIVWKSLVDYANQCAQRIERKSDQLVDGAVNCEVTLEIALGVEIVSIITKTSAASLGLAEGKVASAVIKASSVMIAVD
jgi:molybdopterin-binding protein